MERNLKTLSAGLKTLSKLRVCQPLWYISKFCSSLFIHEPPMLVLPLTKQNLSHNSNFWNFILCFPRIIFYFFLPQLGQLNVRFAEQVHSPECRYWMKCQLAWKNNQSETQTGLGISSISLTSQWGVNVVQEEPLEASMSWWSSILERRMRWARPKPVISKWFYVLQISEKSPQRSRVSWKYLDIL